MRRAECRIGLVVAVLATVGVWAGSTAITSGDSGAVHVSFNTPSGAPGELTARSARGSRHGWCARVVVRGRGGGVDSEDCGEGASRRLHGAFVADCTDRSLIAFGTRRAGLVLRQPRKDRTSIRAVSVRAPSLIGSRARFYAIAIDLREASPMLRAYDRHGHDVRRVSFAAEAARCANALSLLGGF